MNEKNRKVITTTITELLEIMGMETTIDEEKIEDIGDESGEIFTINLTTEHPNLLIGQYGSNLQSLQHLAGIISKRKIVEEENTDNDEFRFNIDINNYKKQKKESLIKLAETIASQVSYNKNSIALRPMSSYERKIIHMEIANKENLTTESTGEYLTRRVIIKYVEE